MSDAFSASAARSDRACSSSDPPCEPPSFASDSLPEEEGESPRSAPPPETGLSSRDVAQRPVMLSRLARAADPFPQLALHADELALRLAGEDAGRVKRGKGAARRGVAGQRAGRGGGGGVFRWSGGDEQAVTSRDERTSLVPWTRARLRLRRGRSSWLRPRGRRRDRTCGVREWASGSTVGADLGGRFSRGTRTNGCRNVDRRRTRTYPREACAPSARPACWRACA